MLSIEQRYNICLIAEKNPGWTQLQLAKWAYDTFQLTKIPSQGAISRLLAKREVYMNCKEHEKGAIRIRNPTNILIRRVLQEWISQSVWNRIPITIPILQETAQSIWYRLPDEHREGDGSFTQKWIVNCLTKMGLDIQKLGAELPKMPKIWTFDERDVFKTIFPQIPANDIFTVDDTCLAYGLPLDYSQYDTNGNSKSIDIATVMLCSNLDGSEKLNPLVIGKYDSYVSFRNYFPNEPTDRVSEALLGQKMALRFDISFHSNRKAWLTSSLFHDWLVSWDKRLVADGRKIWIVLDDSSSHRIINLRLRNIQLIYTSSNSKFLPFNWGVLDEFKIRYRIKQYNALIYFQRKLEQASKQSVIMTPEQSKLTMSNAFKFIRESWNDIQSETIKSSWKSSGILPVNMNISTEDRGAAYRRNLSLLSELDSLCDQYNAVRKWDHDLLLNLNIETKNTNFLSIQELVDCSIIEKCEKNPVGTVPQKTPENFSFSPNANDSSSTDDMQSLPPQESIISNNTNGDNRNPSLHSVSPSQKQNNLLGSTDYDLSLDLLLNSTSYLPERSSFNVSNLIDHPAMFKNNKTGNRLLPVPKVPMIKSEDFLNDIINSTIPFASTTPNSLSTFISGPDNKETHTSSSIDESNLDKSYPVSYTSELLEIPDQDKIFPSFGMPGIGKALLRQAYTLPQVPSSEYQVRNISEGANNSLLINIDIAKSLGSILKNVLSNELHLSSQTIDEIKDKYESVLTTIKKTRAPTNTQRAKREQYLSNIFSQVETSGLLNESLAIDERIPDATDLPL